MNATKILSLTLVTACALTASARSFFDDLGGALVQRGSFAGKIVFVDTQSDVAFSNVQAVAKLLARATKMNVIAQRHAPAKPAVLKDELGAQVLVAVVSDPAEPLMLLAPEDHWGQINIAKLTDDLPGARARDLFRESRARKEIIRAFSLIAGGGGSRFPGNVMNATTLKKLDLCKETIPVDMIGLYATYLKDFGVTPKKLVSYEKACEEGWAPAPTNEIQKAIWDDFHSLPTKPIKIVPPNQKK